MEPVASNQAVGLRGHGAMSDGGKGDKRRPTDEAAYAANWERLFGAGVDERRQVADLPVAVDGSVDLSVLGADALTSPDLAE